MQLVTAGGTIDRYVLLDDDAPGGARAAYDPRLDRRVALLVIEGDEEQRDRLMAAARSLARLSDPHVVSIHDVGTAGDAVYIAMDYVDGQSLDQWQSSRPWPDVVNAYAQAGRGLAAWHAAGLPPGGFGAGDVVVDASGRARLLRFDLATHRGDEHDDQRALCRGAIAALRDADRYDDTPAEIRGALERGAEDDPANQWPTMAAAVARLSPTRTSPGTRALTSLAVVGPLAALIAWAAWNQRGDEADQACMTGADIAADVWNADRRDRIAAAFEDTGVWFAADTWGRLAGAIDEHVDSWVAMHRAACLATESGTQSDQLLDLRMKCLQDHRMELDYLLRAVEEPDVAMVTRAALLPDKLPALARCADVEGLLATVPPPTEDAAGRVAAVREDLARARARLNTGRLDAALSIASGALDDAREIGYRLATAEASVLVGDVLVLRNNPDEARPAFERAVAVGLATGDDRLAADAASQLVYIVGFQQASHDAGLWWARQGDALLDRLRADDLGLRANHLMRTAIIYDEMGAPTRAVELLERALALAVEAYDDQPSRIAAVRSNLASAYQSLGDIDRTIELQRHVLAEQQSLWGEQHPLVIGTINNLAVAESARRNHDAALAYYQQALDIAMRDPAAYESDISFVEGNMGALLVDMGRHGEAREMLERALATHEHLGRAELPLGSSTRLQLGRALAHLGDHEAAEVHLREALRLRAATYGADHYRVAYAKAQLGMLLALRGDRAEAVALLEAAEAAITGDTNPVELADTRVLLADALGPGARARALVDAAVAFFESDRDRYADLLERARDVRRRVSTE